MKTRWLVLLLGASFAANVTLGAALWVSWHGGRILMATAGQTCSAPLCEEEKKLREELATSLCAHTPDRAAIGAALARLDEVRARQRTAIVERWVARCSGADNSERAALVTTVQRMLCPWQAGNGAACCPPSPAPGTHPAPQPQHGRS
jgi:hypothetical protein